MDTSEAGRIGALALHAKLSKTPKKLRVKMQKAVKARWDKYYKAHPEKYAAAQARKRKGKRKAA
jgi:hypothetical protein